MTQTVLFTGMTDTIHVGFSPVKKNLDVFQELLGHKKLMTLFGLRIGKLGGSFVLSGRTDDFEDFIHDLTRKTGSGSFLVQRLADEINNAKMRYESKLVRQIVREEVTRALGDAILKR